MNWFATFLLLYAAGTAGAAALVPSQPIGAYFFRFHGFVVLAFASVACLVAKPWSGWPAVAPLAATILGGAALVSAIVGRRAVLAAVALAGAFFAAAAGQRPLPIAHLATSAAVLGTSLVAMTLGHWYLVNAALSFDLLRRLTRAFATAVAVKLVVSGALIAGDWARIWALTGEHFDGILVAVRVLAGLGGGLALALMAHSCAKMRANQSATGILYVAVIVVLIGELVSVWLTLGRPEPLPL